MPRKDKTFSHYDLFRIFNNNLTVREQKMFLKLFDSVELEDTTKLCETIRNMVDLGEEISTILIPLRAIPGLAVLVATWDGYVLALIALERLICGRR